AGTFEVDLHDLQRLSGGNGDSGARFHQAILPRQSAIQVRFNLPFSSALCMKRRSDPGFSSAPADLHAG
ncbi:hypothetical protein NKI72_21775, partial [Mesorhizobium sp. M0437]|uniref:hypothetical protein n=1 Tax=Mesorhizobium sp. M0437 TaxID=2956945 RepID=UPI00333855C6